MPMQAINEVSKLIGRGNSLSPSLRMTKYAMIGGDNEKKDAVDFVCGAKALDLRPDSIATSIPGAVSFKMKLMGRLIVNQAGGVLENAGLCLHRHFGYPYIPGSALKGIARHAAWLDWEEEEDDDNKSELAKKIALTFGYPTGDEVLDDYLATTLSELFDKNDGEFSSFAGTVSFLPVFPDAAAKLETDVLTCHHMDYYSGKTDRALDNESPNPQFFPCVAEGATFTFSVAPLRRSRKLDFDPLAFAVKYLKIGVDDQGVGAKTSAGYGWFQEDPAIKIAEEARIAEEERIREEEKRLENEIVQVEKRNKQLLDEIEQEKAEEARIAEKLRSALVDIGFSALGGSMDLGKILSLAGKLQEAQNGALSEEEKAELVKLLKASHEATGGKDNNWKKKSKSKDTWKKIRVLLDDVQANALREELS